MYKELYLLLTEACPNRCEYCYIRNRANPSSMTLDLIDEKIKKYNPQRILFFGGEPLVKLDLIEETVKKYYGKIKFQLVTSTSINFKEFIEFNKKHPLNEIQLSWDGFNSNRIDSSGKSIASEVYKNIEYAISRGLRFDIKTVISNNNIQYMYDIHKKFKELKPHGVSGQFVIAHRDLYTQDFYDELAKQLPLTFDLGKMYTDHLNKIIAFINKDKLFASCDIGKYITIDPYGNESLCTALSQERKKFDSQAVQEPCKHDDCRKCKFTFMCDGGCRYERYNQYGDAWQYHYLKSTCKVVKIYTQTIQKFLTSLDSNDRYRLQNIIMEYKSYLRNYYSKLGDNL
jgi:radical SAM protein with 4Fe4S-binding SPASM domain